MEKVGPILPPLPLLAAGKAIPLGQGWVLEPLEKGFLLKSLSLAVQVPVTPDEAQSLRLGEVTVEAMAARHGVTVTHLPSGAAVTVAFSDEAMRLAGKDKAAGKGGGPTGMPPQGMGAGAGLDLPRAARIEAVVAALLLLALIWAL